MKQVKEKFRCFIVENFMFGSDNNSFHDDDSFLEKGIIDSTGVLELVSFVEDEFGIDVKDDELVPDNFDSINNLAEYINTKSNVNG